MTAQPLFEVSDTETGQVLAQMGTDSQDALDRACGRLADQLAASGEGGSRMRYRLAVHAVFPGGERAWCGERVIHPGALAPPAGPCW